MRGSRDAPRARASSAAKPRRAASPLLAAGPVAGAQAPDRPRGGRGAARRAERIVQEARAKAEAILAGAQERKRRAAAARGRRQARVDAETELVARWIALRDKESRRLDSDAERIVPLAMALAERLVGARSSSSPTRIARSRAGVFAEARGARRASIQANPVDAEVLRRTSPTAGLDPRRSRSGRRNPCARRAPAAHRRGNHRCPARTPTRATRRGPPRCPPLTKSALPAPLAHAARVADERLALPRHGRELLLTWLHFDVAIAARGGHRTPLSSRRRCSPSCSPTSSATTSPRASTSVDASLPFFIPLPLALAVRHDGRRHPHALGHPHAPRAPRHRRRRDRSRGSPSPCRSTPGASRTRRSSPSTGSDGGTVELGTSLRHDAARPHLRAARSRRHGHHALPGRVTPPGPGCSSR